MSARELFTKKKVAKPFTVESGFLLSFTNELGSKLTIEFQAEPGIISGTYQSGVSDPKTYPVTGWLSGDVITFTVSFLAERSICAWAGQFIWGPNNVWTIHTLWHLVEPTKPADAWADTFAGSDLFTQVA